MCCRQPGKYGFYDREVFRKTIGFMFAGATLPALSTHALAGVFLQSLVGNPGTCTPTLADVALSVGGIAVHYIREVGEIAQSGALFSTIIFGWCCPSNAFRAFLLKPVVAADSISIDVIEMDVATDKSKPIIIGAARQSLETEIVRMRTTESPAIYDDIPRRALRKLVEQQTHPAVGGAIQYGWATKVGFEPIANGEPIIPALPSGRNMALSVLGFDILELGLVGQYRISLTGRA
jgi:hypothetical protein